ncbi:hypothetical protein FB45DRAFT_892273 [Roridomyces roridus]|uniref:Uncharacterized protein n=1 Tax=Roridomyces roridus TaxID=1738132 RepID=A0AAD7CF81_9AGAR|nr:hypothetical protein FB45DRAFT_892273 [Roridomyces roridus]
MILDDPETGLTKPAAVASSIPTLRLPEAVAGRSASPLPDYETSQAQHDIIFPKPSHFPQRFDSRYWRWSFWALSIYVFLSIVIGIPILATQIAYRKSHQPSPPPKDYQVFLDDGDDQAARPYMPAVGGMLMANSSIACDDWDSLTMAGSLFQTTAQHALSATGLISIRSNATDEVVPHPGGMNNLTVDFNDDPDQTAVVFRVTLTASSAALRDQVHICFNSAQGNPDRGLSVYFPSYVNATDVLAMDIRVLFPQARSTLTDLVTYLPMFDQYFGALSSKVTVQNINIAGAGLSILCQSLRANNIAVKTSFASIAGIFNVTQSLKLDNIEGSIQSNITLTNNPSTRTPTYLTLDTGNSDINADVVMVAPTSSSEYPPQFNGHVKTFNGSLALNVTHGKMTQPAMLDLLVENNQALTSLGLDSKFAGLYDLRTKLSWVQVGHVQNLVDPTGHSRQWNLDVDSQSTATIRGWLGFGSRPTGSPQPMMGSVRATSTLGPIFLDVGS